MEIFLNIIPQHLIHIEIRRIVKYIQTFGTVLKNICKIKIAIAVFIDNKMDFIAIMTSQKTNQPMPYWSEETRKVWHDGNGGKLKLSY